MPSIVHSFPSSPFQLRLPIRLAPSLPRVKTVWRLNIQSFVPLLDDAVHFPRTEVPLADHWNRKRLAVNTSTVQLSLAQNLIRVTTLFILVEEKSVKVGRDGQKGVNGSGWDLIFAGG